jgi:hypothetical protein
MSQPALVALATGPDRFTLWIDPEGGRDAALRRRMASQSAALTRQPAGPVLARGVPFEAVIRNHLDPLEHDALVVVDVHGRAVPHRVVPFVLATADGLLEGDAAGATVALLGRAGGTLDPAYVRGWVHGTTIDARLFSVERGFEWLDDAVRRLGGDRFESHVLPSRQ